MPQKFHLSLLIHAHQPCGNFEHVLEKAYDSSYLPFIEHLEKHPKVHLGLHYSGPLLWRSTSASCLPVRGLPSAFGNRSFPPRWPPQMLPTLLLTTCISSPRA